MRLRSRWLPSVLSLAVATGPVPLLPLHAPPDIRWRPDPPRQGSLVVIVARLAVADTALRLGGTLAGEPLHFEPDGDGGFAALGAVPISAADTIPLQVAVGPDTFVPLVPVTRRLVTREQLRTAPRFTRPPDSALAARLERERALVIEALAHAHATPRLWWEPFARPRPGTIRSDFGRQREFNGVVESSHLGVDFAGRRGAPVRVANRGVVVLVEELFYAGRTVYVNHGAGLLTAYMHLDRPLVAVGDTVARGQLIGRVGATGRVTGPHLHWLARYGAIAVDPLDLLTLDLTPLTGNPSPKPAGPER